MLHWLSQAPGHKRSTHTHTNTHARMPNQHKPPSHRPKAKGATEPQQLGLIHSLTKCCNKCNTYGKRKCLELILFSKPASPIKLRSLSCTPPFMWGMIMSCFENANSGNDCPCFPEKDRDNVFQMATYFDLSVRLEHRSWQLPPSAKARGPTPCGSRSFVRSVVV